MEEHGMYFGKNEFYQIIRNNGGVWNDSKERPIICLMKSVEYNDLCGWVNYIIYALN